MSENNSSVAANTLGFWLLFKTAFAGAFAKLGSFLFYGVILGLLSFGLSYFNTYMAGNLIGLHLAIIFPIMLLYITFGFFVGVFSSLIYKSITKSYFHKGVTSFFSHVSYSFSNLMKAAGVTFRVVWYVGKWFFIPLIIALILFPLFLAAPTFSIVSAVSLIEPDQVYIPEESFRSLVSRWGVMLANVIVLIGGVIAVIRFPKAMFAMTAFVEDGIAGKKALETSQNLTKGRWWKVFGYMFLFLLIFMLAFYALVFLASLLMITPFIMGIDFAMVSIVVGVLLVLLGVILSAVSSVFIYKFYLELKKI